MLIRDYTSSDFGRICTIGKLIDPIPPPLYFRATIGEGRTWIAEENGEVVGFLISTLKNWKEPQQEPIILPYISSVAVDYAYQHRGIAAALIQHFEEYYKKFGCFGLYVRTDNPAKHMYTKFGYSVQKVLERFYGENKDGYFMVKFLSKG